MSSDVTAVVESQTNRARSVAAGVVSGVALGSAKRISEHLIRLRRAQQMQSLHKWNVELGTVLKQEAGFQPRERGASSRKGLSAPA